MNVNFVLKYYKYGSSSESNFKSLYILFLNCIDLLILLVMQLVFLCLYFIIFAYFSSGFPSLFRPISRCCTMSQISSSNLKSFMAFIC